MLKEPDGSEPDWFGLGPWWSRWEGASGWPEGVEERFRRLGLGTIWPDYEAFARSDSGMFSIRTGHGRVQSMQCNVFFDVEWLRARVAPLLEIVAVEPAAYGYQTAVLLRRRES